MFPLYDEETLSAKYRFVTLALILVNIVVFFSTAFSVDFESIIEIFGVTPGQVLSGSGLLTLFTSMFLHADLVHLLGNMWFLWIFGDNVEGNLGPLKFILFYLTVGVVASLIDVYTASPERLGIPTIGASGAISGVLGGYVILYPHNKIRTQFWAFFRPYVISIPAYLYLGVWFLYQLVYIGTPTNIAYMAHIGGFVAGAIFILPLREKILIVEKSITGGAKIEERY
ncbi:MAG: rhomboid family intramembrane serine protease [bacterium]|nr:rhomboid family intramembrane serine protease [bacterium]